MNNTELARRCLQRIDFHFDGLLRLPLDERMWREVMRPALERVIECAESLDANGTLLVEGQENFALLGRAAFPSSTDRTIRYDVEVRLYGQRIVLTCSCARFRFTRGEYANGRKNHCKHIKTFKWQVPDFLDQARNTARQRGATGTLRYFGDAIYEYENADRTHEWKRRVAIS